MAYSAHCLSKWCNEKNLPKFFLACTCVSQWASAEIFSGGQKRHFALQLQVPDDATQIDVHKTLYNFCAIKKMPNVTATVANSVPSKKIYTEQIFVLVSMNILILKTELAEF